MASTKQLYIPYYYSIVKLLFFIVEKVTILLLYNRYLVQEDNNFEEC